MIAEGLVALACISNHGCAETASEYRRRSPQLEHVILETERITRNIVPEVLVSYAGPIFLVAAGRTASIRLHRNASYIYGPETSMLKMEWSY